MDNFTNQQDNAQNTSNGVGAQNTYGQNTTYDQSATYGQNTTYDQSTTYAQNTTYDQNASNTTGANYSQTNTFTGATAAWQQQHQQQATPYNNVNPYNNVYYNGVVKKNNEKIAVAVISMILGILSILCCCWIGMFDLILAIPAVILGILTVTKKWAGKGMAIAGIICGGIGILLCVALIIIALIGGGLEEAASNQGVQDLLEEFMEGYNEGYNSSYRYYY